MFTPCHPTARSASDPWAGQSLDAVLSKPAPGPVDEAGTLVELSERPLVCGSVNWETREAVIGGTDHALYVVSIDAKRKARTLFTRTLGHKEWVTGVCHLADGKVLSCGMDGVLWLWNARGVQGFPLSGHAGPISEVHALGGQLGVSCGYDKTVRVWDCARPRGAEAQCLRGHKAPVLNVAPSPDGRSLVSGDRGGDAALWDLGGAATPVLHRNAHEGHVTSVAWGDNSIYYSGGQDGVVCVWDVRAGPRPVEELPLHLNERGKGAVGFIRAMDWGSGPRIATGGADNTVRVLDVRSAYAEECVVQQPDFVYELRAVGRHVLSGCGDGSLLVIDAAEGRCLYGLGAGQAAVRFADAQGGDLVTAGDDGKAMLYSFL
ncbi:unnamed protein product [Pedinophyceae sp. YPF-701]|nr:unnamed protein product [Pedinophyceae sp. YPF-701]